MCSRVLISTAWQKTREWKLHWPVLRVSYFITPVLMRIKCCLEVVFLGFLGSYHLLAAPLCICFYLFRWWPGEWFSVALRTVFLMFFFSFSEWWRPWKLINRKKNRRKSMPWWWEASHPHWADKLNGNNWWASAMDEAPWSLPFHRDIYVFWSTKFWRNFFMLFVCLNLSLCFLVTDFV